MTPYRIMVAANGYRRGRTYKGRGPLNKGAYSKIEPCAYGYMGWTNDQTAETSRLPGSGTFLYHGGLRAIVAARKYLALPTTRQVQIRTNQDRKVLVYNKCVDGRVTCYAAREQD